MENQKSSSKQIMLNYGILLGFASILIAVANFAFGDIYKPHWSVSVIGIVASVAIIVLGIKKFKDENDGLLALGQAIKIGLGIALISGLIYIVYLFVFSSYMEPDFYKNMTEVQEQAILEKNPNMSDEQLEVSKEMMKKFMGPGVTAAMTIAFSLFFGFIVSLIGGLIMKKSNEEITSI
ncbi:MAG: DUF4199 domain-containing protein [Lutibacter sp.]|nr:MAG: DUF4199 domain-containing protein [Lutibacter sp.]